MSQLPEKITSVHDLLARRFAAQHLARRPRAGLAAVARHVVGLQAQDVGAVRLSARARSSSLTLPVVRREKAVVRTWLMRGTLHLVAVADARWLLSLFGERNVRAGARRRAELGLDERTCARALDVLPEILTGRSLARADLVAEVAARKVRIDPAGQAPAHLLAYAAGRGVVCRGPDLDGDEPGYVLLDEWVPAAQPPPSSGDEADEALAQLARRYLTAFGPAAPADLAAWSGLPLGAVRRGWSALPSADLVEAADGLWMLRDAPKPESGPVVRLLPAYDTYLLGYRERPVPAAYAKRIQAGGGVVHPAVVVDGAVAGRWRLVRSRDAATVEVEPFGRALDGLRELLEAEAADLGRFLGSAGASDRSTPALIMK